MLKPVLGPVSPGAQTPAGQTGRGREERGQARVRDRKRSQSKQERRRRLGCLEPSWEDEARGLGDGRGAEGQGTDRTLHSPQWWTLEGFERGH